MNFFSGSYNIFFQLIVITSNFLFRRQIVFDYGLQVIFSIFLSNLLTCNIQFDFVKKYSL